MFKFAPLAVASALALTVAVPWQAASAQPQTFDFKDPKGVNAIAFHLDSKLEPIFGWGTGITGEVTYDPKDPESFKGAINLSAASLTVSHPIMTEHLRSDQWVDAAKNAQITFTFDRVKDVDRERDGHELEVEGTISFAGRTIKKKVEIDVAHHADAAKERGGAEAGDLLILRSEFKVTRAELGIKPGQFTDKVADEIEITVAIVGYSK